MPCVHYAWLSSCLEVAVSFSEWNSLIFKLKSPLVFLRERRVLTYLTYPCQYNKDYAQKVETAARVCVWVLVHPTT